MPVVPTLGEATVRPDSPVPRDAAGSQVEPSSWITAGVFAAVTVWSAVLYKPWVALPFPIRDFGSILDLFQANDSMVGRWSALLDMVVAAGRLTPLSMLPLAALWSAFGDNTVAWQWARFAVMLLVVGSSYALLRRFGASRVGAWVGASLFVIAGSASGGWLLPQVMEPLGILAVLAAAGLALRWRGSSEATLVAFEIALLLAAAILVKEPFVACVPFVILVALRGCDGLHVLRLQIPRRALALVSITGGVIFLVNVLPLILVRRVSAASGTYAAAYELQSVDFTRVTNVLRATLLPVTRLVTFPANAAFLGILAAGLLIMFRGGRKGPEAIPLLLALTLPLAGALLYLPWPEFPGYYAMPYLLGLALALALAITAVQAFGARVLRLFTAAAAIVLIVLGTVMARNAVESEVAQRIVEATVARSLENASTADEIVAAVPNPAASGRLGDGLRRYAQATGARSLPLASDSSCAVAFALAERLDDRALVVALPGLCDEWQPNEPPTFWPKRQYQIIDWKTLRINQVAMQARLWAPEPERRHE